MLALLLFFIMNDLFYTKEVKPKSKTALIFCTYIRLEHFKVTAECLRTQTNNDFDFYISSNSSDKNRVISAISKFTSDLNINIYAKDYGNKFGPFSRFFMAKDLALEGYDRFIFIDDDEIFSKNFIQDCYDQYNESEVKSFWAHRILKVYRNKIKIEKEEIGNYVGPGGMVCSAKLFLNENLFTCPDKYMIVDDLWMSYFILKFTDYKIKTLNTDIVFIKDLKATFKTLGNLKQEFSDQYILPLSKDLPKIV